MGNPIDDLSRVDKAELNGQAGLFDMVPELTTPDYWWQLPAFDMVDATPARKLTVSFETLADVQEFTDRLGVKLTDRSNSMWFPPQERMKQGSYAWIGTPSPTRWPVYIMSKGRADVETAGRHLLEAGVAPMWVVEPQDEDAYRAKYGDAVHVLPFSNLGQGSIPARNWIWEHAKDNGAAWHWVVDDNVQGFYRSQANRRVRIKHSSAPLRVVEDFVDRYENIAFAGLSHLGFAPDRVKFAPITWNTRVYSVTLIRTELDYRWRGRYNEDTDLCLRALKDGWSTALFRSILMKKARTTDGSSNSKHGMKGGNTDNVYNTGDYRRAFADSLKEQHPDVVEVKWKFGRWHHQVDYTGFKANDPKLKPGVVPNRTNDEYGLKLVRVSDEPDLYGIDDYSEETG